MTTYLAFLRGINVGGNSLIKMADLRTALDDAGLYEVRTYIQSGNVFFDSEVTDKDKLAAKISKAIKQNFGLDVAAVVFSLKDWEKVIAAAPKWWGSDSEWKHNLLIMIPPYEMKEVMKSLGDMKPEIEKVLPGEGVLYQSISFKLFHRTHASKMIGTPVYKQMTIRNYNTANKLLKVLK